MNGKIKVRITQVKNQFGKIEPEISTNIEDYLEFEGSIREEINKFKKNYHELLSQVSAEKLKQLQKEKKMKEFWTLCKLLERFNAKLQSKFEIINLKDALQRDLGMSMRFVRDCITFSQLFKRKEVPNIAFGYISALTERSGALINNGSFQDEKRWLLECIKNNKIPPREEYRKRLDKIKDGGK